METSDHSVAIVGAGPIGLTLANLLGMAGVDTVVIERNRETVQEPRAVSIDDESLRTMQAIGLIERVSEGIVPGYGSDYYTPGGRCFVTVEPKGTPYGYPRRNAFRQPALEAVLREGLERFSNVRVMFGTTLDSFSQDRDGVQLDLGGRKLSCDWLVACDGASSPVRERLGIVLDGSTFDERWLIIDLTNSPASRANTHVFCDASRPCIALPGPNLTRRFEFKLLDGESDQSMLEPKKIKELLDSHGAAPESVIARKVVYRFHARQAAQWRKDRVLLAGDAAHLTPPFAGQGMNSGIRDSANLAWKLAAVINGVAVPSLLDSYETERREHVDEMIRLALRMGRIMAPANAMIGWITQSAFLAMRAVPPLSRFFSEMKYKPKPRFRNGFLVHDGRGALTSAVGRLLPQPRIDMPDGETCLLDDVIGNRFALVGFGLASREALAAAVHPFWDQIGAKKLNVALPGEGGGQAPTLDQASIDDAMRLLLARYPAHVFVLRPDRYVAAAGRAGEISTIAERMAGQLQH